MDDRDLSLTHEQAHGGGPSDAHSLDVSAVEMPSPVRDDTHRWKLADAFNRAAPSYDAMVALSPGYHQQLRRSADALMARCSPGADGVLQLADLGCGSGASTAALLEACAVTHPGVPVQVTGVDASGGMLEQARAKSWPQDVSFVEQDALAWLRAQPSASLSGVLAAYLLRNVADRESVVTEISRVLAPGGVVSLQDYSVAGRPMARAAWSAVCYGVIIPMAIVKRSDVPLHRYLYTSVRDFDSVPTMLGRLSRAGLTEIEHVRHSGWQRSMVHTVAAVAR